MTNGDILKWKAYNLAASMAKCEMTGVFKNQKAQRFDIDKLHTKIKENYDAIKSVHKLS